MSDEDYSPVLTADEEEEKRRKEGDYPAPEPDSTPAPDAALKPKSGPSSNMPPVMPTMAMSSSAMPPVMPSPKPETPILAPSQRPQWKDYAPPDPHGWAKFGHAIASISPITDRIVNQRPEQQAERKYSAATKEFEAPIAEQHTEAQTGRERSQAREADQRTQNLANPPEKPAKDAFALWAEQNPGHPVADWFKAQQEGKPEKPEKPDTPEQQFLDEYATKHPGSSIADAERAFKAIQPPEKPGAGDARGDRSYQFHSTRIDKLATPIEQRAERISRLEDTLNQNSPQADALVAPELLTVMAGGQGSGLRMNEAEIARVIGGRDKWESIKSALQQWQLDPKKPFAFQPEQRQEIRNLFSTIRDRVNRKMQILDEYRGQLVDSDDPKAHRQIFNKLQHELNQVDGGGDTQKKEGEPERPAHVPANYIFKADGPKGKGWYKP